MFTTAREKSQESGTINEEDLQKMAQRRLDLIDATLAATRSPNTSLAEIAARYQITAQS